MMTPIPSFKTVFRVIIYILAWNTFISPARVYAQNKEASEAIAMGVGLFAAAWEIDQFFEYLELQAVQQVLEAHPTEGANSFGVKVFRIPKQKISDISNESMLVFSVRFFNVKTQAEYERKVLFAHTSPGWINQNGIEYSRLEWVWYDADQWNELFARFVDISTPINVEGMSVPLVRGISEDEFVMGENQFFLNRMGADNTRKIHFYSADKGSNDVRTLRLSNRGFEYGHSNHLDNLNYIPQYNLGRDQYVSGSLGDKISLVANENTLGLYRRSTGRLVQIKRSVVNDVQGWVNGVRETSEAEQMARSLGINNVEEYNQKRLEADRMNELIDRYQELSSKISVVAISDKTSFKVGDKGYYEIRDKALVRCKIVTSKIDVVKMDFALKVEIDDTETQELISVRSGDDRFRWVTDYIEE